MPKWEYLRLDVTYNDRTINPGIHNIVLNGKEKFSKEDSENWDTLLLYINSLGEEGWELVSVSWHTVWSIAYFKRSKEKIDTVAAVHAAG